jgi:hypothetical protein
VVRGDEPLARVEHLLGEPAAVVARHGHGRHVVQAAHVERGREVEHVPGAVDVRGDARVVVGRDVVQRGEVHEVVDGAGQLGELLVADAEALGPHVADEVADLLGGGPVACRLGEPVLRALAHQHPHPLGVGPGQDLRDEVPSDQTGRAGHEVGRHP